MRVSRYRTTLVVATACIIATCGILPAPTASAATPAAGNYMTLFWGGDNYDQIANYDTSNKDIFGTSNKDWALDLMFWNNASISKVKAPLVGFNAGGVMYGLLKDNAVFEWDSDRGLKNNSGSCPVNYHARFYADGDDRMFSVFWGFHVFATAHHDVYENCPGAWFGDSEWAEHQFGTEYVNRGFSISRNAFNTLNPEPIRWEGNHKWDNSGWMTSITIP